MLTETHKITESQWKGLYEFIERYKHFKHGYDTVENDESLGRTQLAKINKNIKDVCTPV